MTYDTMSVDALLAEYVHAQWVGFYTGVESEISIKAALRKAVVREASVTWTRKYSLSNASGVSALYGKFPNGYRLDLENPNIPDGDYDLIPHKETP